MVNAALTTIKLKCGLDLSVTSGGTGFRSLWCGAIDTKTTHQFAVAQDHSLLKNVLAKTYRVRVEVY